MLPGLEILGIDHVQLPIPVGGEAAARAFYGEVLGLREVPKPQGLRARGGLWFQAGPVQLHLGVEKDMRPSAKTHPALVVRSLEPYIRALAAASCEWQSADEVPGVLRGHTRDPFGNRIELMQAP